VGAQDVLLPKSDIMTLFSSPGFGFDRPTYVSIARLRTSSCVSLVGIGEPPSACLWSSATQMFRSTICLSLVGVILATSQRKLRSEPPW